MIRQIRALSVWPRLVIVLLAIAANCQADEPQSAAASRNIALGQGQIAGEATEQSVLLHARLTTSAVFVPPAPGFGKTRYAMYTADVPGMPGTGRFEWSVSATFRDSQLTPWLVADAEQDFILQTRVAGLSPGTTYYYRLHYGPDRQHLTLGPVGKFRTLSGSKKDLPATLTIGSCLNYDFFHRGIDDRGLKAHPGSDRDLGYPALESMRKMNPDLVIFTGDNVYYDPWDAGNPHAQTLTEMRRFWHQQFSQPRLRDLRGSSARYWEKDDHEFRFNDGDMTSGPAPSAELGIRMFREQIPIVARDEPNGVTYRTHRVSKSLQIWLVENRDYRSPNKQPVGPDKTIWGRTQREWLERTLTESDAAFKILISPTPVIGPDDSYKDDNHADPRGFQHEATAFFQRLKDRGFLKQKFLIVCGDRHWQYHSVHPLGFEEMCVGTVVDANALFGPYPGDPKSTDPRGLIKQPFARDKAFAGFLKLEVVPAVASTPPKLVITFCDQNGKSVHSQTRTASNDQ